MIPEQQHLLIFLITAHLLADFVFQTNYDVEKKKNPFVFVKHIIITTILVYLWVGDWTNWFIPVIIFSTHSIIDFLKLYSGKGLKSFVTDQLAHLIIIFGIVFYYNSSDISFYWYELFGASFIKVSVIISGVILTVPTGAITIQYFIAPFVNQSNEVTQNGLPEGLKNGGKVIGYLERFLIFIFVLTNVIEGVGFLIAAKSVFRFGELQDRQNRIAAEYILIGTLYSFAWGLTFAWLTKYLTVLY